MLSSDVSSILNNKDRLLTQTYFDLQKYFEEKIWNQYRSIYGDRNFF